MSEPARVWQTPGQSGPHSAATPSEKLAAVLANLRPSFDVPFSARTLPRMVVYLVSAW